MLSVYQRNNVDGFEADIRKWCDSSCIQQQDFLRWFGDRDFDKMEIYEWGRINDKIAMYLFGKEWSLLNQESRGHVRKASSKARELMGSRRELALGCAYVNVCAIEKSRRRTNEITFPVLRIGRSTSWNSAIETVYFYEYHSGRVYTSWADYLENNRLPTDSAMLFPKLGYYRHVDGIVQLDGKFKSVSASDGFKALSAGMGLFTGVAALGSLFFAPLVVPTALLASATGVVGVSTSVHSLLDGISHQENDGSLVSSFLGICLSAATATTGAKALMSSSTSSIIRRIVTCLSVGSNTFGVAICICSLVAKVINNELRIEDMSLFVNLCLFVANIVVSQDLAYNLFQKMAKYPERMASCFDMMGNTEFEVGKQVLKTGSTAEIVGILFNSAAFYTTIARPMIVKWRILDIVNIIQAVAQSSQNVLQFISRIAMQVRMYTNAFLNEINGAFRDLQKYFSRLFSKSKSKGEDVALSATSMRSIARDTVATDAERNTNEDIIKDVTKSLTEYFVSFAHSFGCNDFNSFVPVMTFLKNKLEGFMKLEAVKHVIDNGNRALPSGTRFLLFQTVMQKMSRESFLLSDEFRRENQLSAMPNDDGRRFTRPLFEKENSRIYYFEANDTSAASLDQFIFDSCNELFEKDDGDFVFEKCDFRVNDEKSDPYIIVQHHKHHVVLFSYEIERIRGCDRLQGMVLSQSNVLSPAQWDRKLLPQIGPNEKERGVKGIFPNLLKSIDQLRRQYM